jgi:hypothetical protein
VKEQRTPLDLDPEALLCALVLVPATFSRNRFFPLYEKAALRRVRRRAGHVRAIVRQLLGEGRRKAEVIGEQVLADGRVLLRYRIQELAYTRTTALSSLEAAVLRYALSRAGAGQLSEEDRAQVELALERLGSALKREGTEPGDLGAEGEE